MTENENGIAKEEGDLRNKNEELGEFDKGIQEFKNDSKAKPPPWVMFGLIIDRKVGNTFAKMSRWISRNPWKVIIACLLVAGILIPGMFLLITKTETREIWIPQVSIAIDHEKFVDDTFEASPRYQFLIMTRQDEGDILNPDGLLELLKYEQDAQQLTSKSASKPSYDDVCTKSSAGKCITSSILTVWGGNATIIQALTPSLVKTHIKGAIDSGAISDDNVRSLCGGLVRDSKDDPIKEGKALKLIWLLEDGDDSVEYERVLLEKFKEWSDDAQKEGTYSIFYEVGSSFTWELDKSISSDIWLIGISITLIVFYTSFVLGKHDWVRSRKLLAQAGVGCVGLAVGSAFGLAGYIGVFMAPPNQIIAFLVLGIGVDTTFIITDAYERTNPNRSISERVGDAMEEVGGSITMTSLTDGFAFLAGSMTALPAMQSFCLYASFSVLINFLFQILLFPAALAIDSRRIRANRYDCVFWKIKPDIESHSEESATFTRKDSMQSMKSSASRRAFAHAKHSLSEYEKDGFIRHFFREHYVPFLLRPVVRVCVLIFFFGLMGFMIWGAVQLKQDFEVKDLAPDGSYVIDYVEQDDKHFGGLPMGYSIYTKKEDYTDSDISKKIQELEDNAKDYKLSDGSDAVSWHAAFRMNLFVKGEPTTHGVPSNTSRFYPLLTDFLSTKIGSLFTNDVVFTDSSKTQIKGARIHAKFVSLDNASIQVEGMQTVREEVKKVDIDAFPFAGYFIYFEQFAIIIPEAIQNLSAAAAAVFVITMIFLLHPWAALITVFIVLMIDADLLGLMFLYGLNVDSITICNLVIAVGLSVDYSAHVCHAFMTAGGTREQRVSSAMSNMGGSVMNGALSTFIGIVMLAFGSSVIFRTFFKMLMGNILFGIFHGLMFLPVVLSIVGPQTADPRVDASHLPIDPRWAWRKSKVSPAHVSKEEK